MLNKHNYSKSVKDKAIFLRKKGYSINEISKISEISKSTSSLWVGKIVLNEQAKKRIAKRRLMGIENLKKYKLKIKTDSNKKRLRSIKKLLLKIPSSKELFKLYCALLYWCEGGKTHTSVRFISSDPSLIKLFLSLLRKGFDINESKLRALMHLHKYHNETVQKKYWSKVTNIPLKQFNKSYFKPNAGKRIHKDYPGCLAVYYYNVEVEKQLEVIYNTFSQSF